MIWSPTKKSSRCQALVQYRPRSKGSQSSSVSIRTSCRRQQSWPRATRPRPKMICARHSQPFPIGRRSTCCFPWLIAFTLWSPNSGAVLSDDHTSVLLSLLLFSFAFFFFFLFLFFFLFFFFFFFFFFFLFFFFF